MASQILGVNLYIIFILNIFNLIIIVLLFLGKTNNFNVYLIENLLNNDHETPDRTKASTSISRYQNNSGKYNKLYKII